MNVTLTATGVMVCVRVMMTGAGVTVAQTGTAVIVDVEVTVVFSALSDFWTFVQIEPGVQVYWDQCIGDFPATGYDAGMRDARLETFEYRMQGVLLRVFESGDG